MQGGVEGDSTDPATNMASRPKVPDSPLDLFDGALIEEPLLTKFWGPVVLGGVGFLSVCFANFATKRPVFSGIQKHAFVILSFGYAGKYLDDYRRDYFAEKDAVLKHYITLHPEDFPPYERKKFKDVLNPWIPIR